MPFAPGVAPILDFFGVTREQVIGKPLLEATSGSDEQKERYRLLHAKTMTTGTPHFQDADVEINGRKHQIHDNMQYDLYYVRHRSLFLDLAILIHTVFFAIKGI